MDGTGRRKINISRRKRNQILVAAGIIVSCYMLSTGSTTHQRHEEVSISNHLQPPDDVKSVPWVTVAGGWPSKCNEAVAYLRKHGIVGGCSGSVSYGLEVSAKDSIQALHLLRAKYSNSKKFSICTHPVLFEPTDHPEVRAFHVVLDAHLKIGMPRKRVVYVLKRCGLLVSHGASDWGMGEDILRASRRNQPSDEWRPGAEFWIGPSGKLMSYYVLIYYYPKQGAPRVAI